MKKSQGIFLKEKYSDFIGFCGDYITQIICYFFFYKLFYLYIISNKRKFLYNLAYYKIEKEKRQTDKSTIRQTEKYILTILFLVSQPLRPYSPPFELIGQIFLGIFFRASQKKLFFLRARPLSPPPS